MSRATEILEELPRRKRTAAGCMVIAGAHTLLLQRARHSEHEPLKWAPPGGRVDRGETPWEAAIRETKEEAGIDLSDYTPARQEEQETQSGNVYTTFIYYLKPDARSILSVQIDHESEDWGWFTKNEMKRLDLHPEFLTLLNEINF